MKSISRRAAIQSGVVSMIAGATTLSACKDIDRQNSYKVGGGNETWVKARDMRQIAPPRWPIAAKPKTMPVEGGELWFLDNEKGEEAILFLHALTGSARSWAYQFPVFSKAGYRVIAPSVRGAFGTTAPMAVMRQQIEDIRTLINDLNIKQVHLVGTAYGGVLALRYALENIKQLKSVTLACSLCGLSEPSYKKSQSILLHPEVLALPVDIKELGASYRHSNPNGAGRWKDLTKDSAATNLKTLTQQHRDRIISSIVDDGPSYADILDFKIPVHLIFGGADLYAPPSLGRLLNENFGNSKLTLIQETGHSVYWEQPDVFNKVVMDFLDTNS